MAANDPMPFTQPDAIQGDFDKSPTEPAGSGLFASRRVHIKSPARCKFP